LQELPITLTLKSGATEANYGPVTTDASGFFTIGLGTLPVGTYDWRAKGPRFLANSGVLSLTGAPAYSLSMGLMRAGDANNDNRVTLQDFTIVRASFGLAAGDPGYDDRADFTGDQVVNVADFNLVKNNFGLSGSPSLGPLGRGQTRDEGQTTNDREPVPVELSTRAIAPPIVLGPWSFVLGLSPINSFRQV
jgi:hypothetical protein